MSKSIVAIVGRQNVGKSTLLNRLAGKRIAIVEDLPGTTRDRVLADISWHGEEFTLVDTGGLEIEPGTIIGAGVKAQVKNAIEQADAVIFMTDVRHGVVTSDHEVADLLRQINKPVILAVNKADNDKYEMESMEFFELGLGEPLAISAHHGRGTAELLDKVSEILPPAEIEPQQDMMKVAIVGRPNVGKSMLLNALLGMDRAIVDNTPGTTRDAIDTVLDFDGQSMILIDTAGIRRRGKLEAGIEKYSVIRALRAIDRADVSLLVMDATELPTAQDTHVAGFVQQAYKGIVLIVNKWDLVTDKNKAEWDKYIRSHLRFMAYAPVLYTSAKYGDGVSDILPHVTRVYDEMHKRIPTAQVHSTIQKAIAVHNPPRKGNRQFKILHATQAEVAPPTFVFFVNDSKLLHFSYRRYLENKIRESFGFNGTPLRMVFKNRGE